MIDFSNTFNNMILTISESEDEVTILQSMVNILGQSLQVDRSLIYNIDLKEDIAGGLCEWLNPSLHDLTPSIGKYPLSIFRNGAKWVLKKKSYLISQTQNKHQALLKDNSSDLLHTHMNIKSLIWFPFDFQEDRFFLLVFNQVSYEREWKEEEIQFISAAARQVSVALKKVRILQALALREKQLLFEQNLFNSGPVVVFRWKNVEGLPVEYVSDNIIQFGFHPPDFLAGKLPFLSIIHQDDRDLFLNELILWSERGVESFEQEYRMILPDGNVRYVYDFTKIIRNHTGEVTYYHGYIFDITERKKTEDHLFNQKEEALVTLQSIGDGVITANQNGVVKFINPAAEQLTGWSNDEATGHNLNDVLRLRDEKDDTLYFSPLEFITGHKSINAFPRSLLIAKDESIIPVEHSTSPIKNRNGDIDGVVVVFHDVLNARQLAKKLEWQASHDSLTDLYNRREFEKHLDAFIDDYTSHGNHHSLLYLDLDQFKIINDTCGHSAGDELLRQLSFVILNTLTADAILARLGGDEFGILLKDCTLAETCNLAEQILHQIRSHRFRHQDKYFEIGASIGIVQIRGESPDILFSNADMACYAAKDLGRNRYHVFRENDIDITRRHDEMQWVSRLNHAINENKFQLYYQEIKSLQGGSYHGHCEILLRMCDDKENIVSPGEFLSAAERFNLMTDIDQWVIKSVFKNYADHSGSYADRNIHFSINLSGLSLSSEKLLEFILANFQFYNVPPGKIIFEITETAAISNLNKLNYLMSVLKSLGVRFSLDDFGSGLSSFLYLKHLPVNYIKIDGGFISEILNDPMDMAIVESINHIGHTMKLQTIAEYVKTDSIKSALEKLGVDFVQGYAIHEPEPLERL